MLRDLLKEGGLYTLANILTKGVSLLLIPFYTSYFIPSDYGIIDILTVFGAFINAILSLQLNQGLARYISEKDVSIKRRVAIASTSLWISVGVYLIAFILIYFFDDFIVQLLSAEVTIPKKTLLLSVGSISINAIFYLLGVYLRYLRKTKLYSLFTFIHAISNILLTLVLVIFLDYGIDGIFLASIYITPIILVFQIIAMRKDIDFQFSNSALKKLLRFSLPLIPASIAYVLLNFTDRIYIKEFLSFEQEGIYGIASRFSQIISLIIVGFSMALSPIVYQNYKSDTAKDQLARIFRLFFGVGSIGVLALSLFSFETLWMFTNEKYYDAYTIIPFLYTSVFITGFGMFAVGLHIKEKTKIIALIVIVAGLVNIGLNYLLISYFKLEGAALATVISVIINNFGLLYFSQKHYKIPFAMGQFILVGGIFLAFMLIGNYLTAINYLDFSIQGTGIRIGAIMIYALILYRLNMFGISKLKQLIK